MTLVFRDPAPKPGTHVLIVGIGRYPSYPGFVPGENNAGQIDSAEIGAQHVANWFMQQFHNPERPLASLRILLSNEEDNAWKSADGAKRVAEATAANFLSTYDDWLNDAIADPGCTQVLYFAGHGIGTMNDHSLICADYNTVAKRHMEGAIDFNNLLWTTSTNSKAW